VIALAGTGDRYRPEWPIGLAGTRNEGLGTSLDVPENGIFEAFFVPGFLGQSARLGLTVVRGIVERAGGSFHVAGAPGQGSRFRVFLPVAG